MTLVAVVAFVGLVGLCAVSNVMMWQGNKRGAVATFLLAVTLILVLKVVS